MASQMSWIERRTQAPTSERFCDGQENGELAPTSMVPTSVRPTAVFGEARGEWAERLVGVGHERSDPRPVGIGLPDPDIMRDDAV